MGIGRDFGKEKGKERREAVEEERNERKGVCEGFKAVKMVD